MNVCECVGVCGCVGDDDDDDDDDDEERQELSDHEMGLGNDDDVIVID